MSIRPKTRYTPIAISTAVFSYTAAGDATHSDFEDESAKIQALTASRDMLPSPQLTHQASAFRSMLNSGGFLFFNYPNAPTRKGPLGARFRVTALSVVAKFTGMTADLHPVRATARQAGAWIDGSKCDARDEEIGIVGYEIPFNRHFYQYEPPRDLAEIDADLDILSKEIMEMLREVHS